MSTTVHHFAMVLEKIAVDPAPKVTTQPSGRRRTQFLPINRSGTQSTTPGTTLLGRQVRSSAGTHGSSGTVGTTRQVRDVVTGDMKTVQGPVTRGGRDSVTQSYLPEASNAQLGEGTFNPNQGLSPRDATYNMFAASPGYQQTALPGGGTQYSNRTVSYRTHVTGNRSAGYNARMHGSNAPTQMTHSSVGAPGGIRAATGIGTNRPYTP